MYSIVLTNSFFYFIIPAALAEDHFNDVISNAVAMVTAAVAFHTTLWWFDPVGRYYTAVVDCYNT